MKAPHGRHLQKIQALGTSGARAIAFFDLNDVPHLAVPQLAIDIPSQPANVEAGRSDDVPVLIYQWTGERFQERLRLSANGSEDVEPFRIGDDQFLAVANLRSGHGPYDLNVDSMLYRWSGCDFAAVQSFPTFAAKQWRHFEVDARHFLALAQGVDQPGATSRNPAQSAIYEWDGQRFRLFQTIESIWGYNWLHIRIGDEHLLAYADHKSPSRILRWTGETFALLQLLDGDGGRAFSTFDVEGTTYLAFARLTADSVLLRWDGERFIRHQRLSGAGGREFATLEQGGDRLLLQVDFLTGSREQPRTDLYGHVYRWDGSSMQEIGTFPTSGATDIAILMMVGGPLVAVSESLSPEIRFRQDSNIYRLTR